MFDALAELAFWASAALILYGYAGYPLLIYVLGRRHVRRAGPFGPAWTSRVPKDPAYGNETTVGLKPDTTYPTVSVLVPAYNEERAIAAKIENCLALDYPRDRLEILVASDGSTDATPRLIGEASDGRLIRGVTFTTRRGKTAVLNDLAGAAAGEILVFSDAASLLDPGSLRALVRPFADPRIGCVSGVYRVIRPAGPSDASQESAYWRYETFVRLAESRLGTMLGAHGSLYGIRRELFEPLDPRIINDDFVIPMTVLLKGFRSVYEATAVAREDGREMAGFSRRVRIMTGNYQQFAVLLRRGGWTKRPWLLFQLLSHKGLRLVSPFLFISAYVGNALLLSSPWYRVAFAAQTAFFLAAMLGASPRLRRVGGAPIAGPHYLCMANMAALVGLHRTVWQGGHVAWKSRRVGG